MTQIRANEDIQIVTSWVDNEAGRIHPAFAVEESHYDDRLQKYVPGKPDRLLELSLRKREEEFKALAKECEEAMKALNQNRHSEPNSVSPTIVHASWEDVLDALDEARQRWEDKATGKRNIFRRQGRTLGDKARYVQPWMNLLPNSDYGSILCGGLKLILSAATAKADTQNEILKCLKDLPAKIEIANGIFQLFGGMFDREQELKLRNAILSFSIAILNAVQLMVNWFDQSAGRKAWDSIRKNSLYPIGFHEAVTHIIDRADDLRHLAEEFHRRIDINTNQVAHETNGTVSDVKDMMLELKTDLTHHLGDIVKNAAWENELSELAARLERIEEKMSRPTTPLPPPSQPVIYQVVMQPPVTVSKDTIMRFLNIDGKATQLALMKAGSPSLQKSQDAKLLIQLVLKNPRFGEWMRSINSGILALRRGPTDGEASRIFGFLAATLVETLSNTSSAAVLHLFCFNENLSYSSGSLYLLRSLICQLIQYQNTAAINPDMLSVPNYEFNHLRNLFLHIVQSLPQGQTVFIIIHGLGYHETDDEAEVMDLLYFFSELGNRPPDSRLRIKVFLTPLLPMATRDIVPFENFIDLPQDTGHLREYSLKHIVGELGDVYHEQYE